MWRLPETVLKINKCSREFLKSSFYRASSGRRFILIIHYKDKGQTSTFAQEDCYATGNNLSFPLKRLNNLARTLVCWNCNTDPNWLEKAGIYDRTNLYPWRRQKRRPLAQITCHEQDQLPTRSVELSGSIHSTPYGMWQTKRLSNQGTFTFHTLSIVSPICETFRLSF